MLLEQLRPPWLFALQKTEVKRHQKQEIKSDEIEFDLYFHMPLLFSASSFVLLSSVLLSFFYYYYFPPCVHSPACGAVCSPSIEFIFWCQVVNLLCFIWTRPAVFKRKCALTQSPENTSGWFMLLWWFLQGPPPIWGKCHKCSRLCFPSFLFRILKVSFDRTLAVELALESSFKSAIFPLRARFWQLCFSLAFSSISWVLNWAKPPAEEQNPRSRTATQTTALESAL